MEAVFEVHNILGPGYSENIYEEALVRELKRRNIPHERQKTIDVLYKGEILGEYKLDIVISDKIILEFKAVTELNKIFESQLISYLKATKLKLGILVNFGTKKVTYKRILV